MAQLLIPPKYREFDSNGDPLVGGKLYSYLAGTTTPAATYTDESGSTPNTNPVILDADGRADVWLSSSTTYKLVLKDSSDVTIWTVDDVSAAGTGGSSSESGAWVEHEIANSLTNYVLSGATADSTTYSSVLYDCEIIRGATPTIIANGQVAMQCLNGTWRVSTGIFMAGEAHGVTFGVTQSGTVGQLVVSTTASPAGLGTLKLSARRVPV